jgi:hypothetical protein
MASQSERTSTRKNIKKAVPSDTREKHYRKAPKSVSTELGKKGAAAGHKKTLVDKGAHDGPSPW